MELSLRKLDSPSHMKRKLLFIVLIFSVLFLTGAMNAQAQKRYRGQHKHQNKHRASSKSRGLVGLDDWKKHELVSIYANVGYALYYGDLCDKIECFSPDPLLGVGVLYRTPWLSERLYARMEFNYFRMSIKNDVYPTRNLSFRSGNMDMFFAGHFSFMPYEKNFRRRYKFEPYIFAGFGMTYYNPRTELNGEWYTLRDIQTEGVKYSPVTFQVVYGGGVKYNLDINWTIFLELGYHVTFTDYLDDVSSASYADPSTLSSTTAQQLSYRATEPVRTRGNPEKNDGYFNMNFKVAYTFSSQNFAKFRGRQRMIRKY
jgi:hypothetical protein